MKRIILTLLFTLTTIFAADVSMEIVKKSNTKPKILISSSLEGVNRVVLEKVRSMIEKDLNISGHFNIIEDTYKVEIEKNADYVYLGRKNVDLFLNINFDASVFNGLKMFVKVYDVNDKKLVLDKKISTSNMNRYPFLAHRISIAVNSYMNAPSIKWMDKFVIYSVYKRKQSSNIYISDYTLTYKKIIVSGGLNIFPKWSNKKQDSFYYTKYVNSVPTVYKVNIYNNKKKKILQSDGMVVVSDVSADGSKLLITAAPYGQPDVYLLDLKTNKQTRVTRYKGIDVGAHFIDNDKKIVFVSDRLSRPNIFSKSINGRGIEKLVYHGTNNSSVSTFKNRIVYTSRDKESEFDKKSFNLYLISTTSDAIKKLTSSGVNQFPKFSKDGESILFIKNTDNKSSLGIIRLNYNKMFLFPLFEGRIQSIDW
ncbi:MAG: Tol-Pal system protein TolB [Campylobacteraceae bacterium]|nr:Tol-Pal system protein TolB [Campylobacteraceae bacterium]